MRVFLLVRGPLVLDRIRQKTANEIFGEVRKVVHGSGDLQERDERKRILIRRPCQQALTVFTTLYKECIPNDLEDGG